MILKIESDDVLYLIQGLAAARIEHGGDHTPDAINTAHAAVQDYLGIDIEFVVDGAEVHQLRQISADDDRSGDPL